MSTELTIIIGIVGLISTILGLLGITAFVSERAKIRATKTEKAKEKTEQILENAAKQELEAALKTIIKDEVKPVREGVNEIKQELILDKAATITSIRANLKQLRDHYKAQGYADAGDIGTWNELYDNYKALGGNHFKAYVDTWKQEVNNLPLEPKTNK